MIREPEALVKQNNKKWPVLLIFSPKIAKIPAERRFVTQFAIQTRPSAAPLAPFDRVKRTEH
jgi:hypothetical protein